VVIPLSRHEARFATRKDMEGFSNIPFLSRGRFQAGEVAQDHVGIDPVDLYPGSKAYSHW
jgi:hypothetical protein